MQYEPAQRAEFANFSAETRMQIRCKWKCNCNWPFLLNFHLAQTQSSALQLPGRHSSRLEDTLLPADDSLLLACGQLGSSVIELVFWPPVFVPLSYRVTPEHKRPRQAAKISGQTLVQWRRLARDKTRSQQDSLGFQLR